MAVNIHITIIELNALHTKRQNLFQELDAVIHLLMEAKHWGLRKSRNATSLNSRFKSLDTLKVKIISVTFRRVIRTNHKKASKIWRFSRNASCRERLAGQRCGRITSHIRRIWRTKSNHPASRFLPALEARRQASPIFRRRLHEW